MNIPKPGSRSRCPGCGEETLVKLRPRVEGWRVVGQDAVCALCGYVFGAVDDDASEKAEGGGRGDAAHAAAFLGLGEEFPRRRDARDVLGADAELRFCKNCRYFFRHPFVVRCLLHDRPTEPMQDCPSFEPRRDDECDSAAEEAENEGPTP